MHSNSFNLTFPFQKVNQEQRTVTGIATADNVDLVNDRVLFKASVEAFSDWIGNIREMHAPIAVGKLIDWKTVPVMYDGKMYQGIQVTVYISKGAQDTWEKILDGTLKGFSIGGYVKEAEKVFYEDLQQYVQEIRKYTLGELSVVDNPCNPAGMFAMIKSIDGELHYTAELMDVYYCEKDKFASVDSPTCPVCAREMPVVGKVEEFSEMLVNKVVSIYEDGLAKGGDVVNLQSNENHDNVESMSSDLDLTEDQKKSVLSKLGDFLFGKAVDVSANNGNLRVVADGTNPGGTVIVNVTPGVVTSNVSGVDGDSSMAPDDTAVSEIVETPQENLGESASAEESENEALVERDNQIDIPTASGAPSDDAGQDPENINKSIEGEEEMDFEKLTEAIGSMLDEKLEKVKAEISAEVDGKIDAIEKSVSEVAVATETLSGDIEKVANSGAGKKSEVISDDEVEDSTLTKSVESEGFWGGVFVPVALAKSLGYES